MVYPRKSSEGPYYVTITRAAKDELIVGWSENVALWLEKAGHVYANMFWSREGNYVCVIPGAGVLVRQGRRPGRSPYHGPLPAGTRIRLEPVRNMLVGYVRQEGQ